MQLGRQTIVDAAIAILDAHGLGDLTMRRLARALEVAPGAIYWYFPNKQVLLGAIADDILSAVPADPATGARDGGDWADSVTAIATAVRAALLATRSGAEIVAASMAARTTTHPIRELLIGACEVPLGDHHAAVIAAESLLYFILGHTVDEQARRMLAEFVEGSEQPDPAVADAGFTFGLSLFVGGLERRRGPATASGPGTASGSGTASGPGTASGSGTASGAGSAQ